MKIKFARTLAIASALSVAFAGLTAFAAAGVQTITTYDHTAADSASVTVTTTVTGLKDGAEVAYYVCEEGASGAVTDKIVYIDQGTYDETARKLEFKFTDTKAKFLTAMAKFGTDTAKAADETAVAFPTFYFNEGTNALDQNTADIETGADWGVKVVVDSTNGTITTPGDINWNGLNSGETADMSNAYSFKGQLSGNAKNYGVKIVRTTGVTDYFPAYGCADDGTFVVIVENLTINSGDDVTYFVNVEQSVLESTSSSTQQ